MRGAGNEADKQLMSDKAPVKILVIEDEPTQRILAKEYLEQAGYLVRSSDDGKHGFNMAMKTEPDLIILDLMLPSMDGYELCQSFRNTERTKDTPIILVTASKESDVIKRGLAAGANDFVTKPVDWQFLADRVAFVLNQSREKQQIGRQVEELAEVEAEVAAVACEKTSLQTRLSELEKAEARAREEIAALHQQLEAAVEAGAAAEQVKADEIEASAKQITETLKAEFEAQFEEQQRQFDELLQRQQDEAAAAAAEIASADNLEQALEAARAEERLALEAAASAAAEALDEAHRLDIERLEADFAERLAAQRQEFEQALDDAEARYASDLAMARDTAEELRKSLPANAAGEPLEAMPIDEASDAATDGPASPRVRAMWRLVEEACQRYQDGLEGIVDRATDSTQSADEGAAEIARSANVLARSVAKLAKLAHAMTQTNDGLGRVRFDACEFLTAIADSVRPFADKRQAILDIAVPSKPVTLEADPHRLRFAATIIAINALKTVEPGGSVRLALQQDPTGGMKLTVGGLRAGLSQADLETLNTCLDKPARTKGAGYGDFGLDVAIATALARHHGGNAVIVAGEDRTASVEICLPFSCVHGEGDTGSEQEETVLDLAG